jgi:hypothetical protein
MMVQRILERLKANAQTGEAYSKDPFDIERFKEQKILVEELTAFLSKLSLEEVQMNWPSEQGYATPKIDVRSAVFKDGEILLSKERSDGKWTLPGGWADVELHQLIMLLRKSKKRQVSMLK